VLTFTPCMNLIPTRLALQQTGYFSKIVCDYIDQQQQLTPFFNQPPSWQGLEAMIEEKEKHPVNRDVLTTALRQQYNGLTVTKAVTANIEALQQPGTFTICTAHQPNIFTGHSYVLYKILHAIQLAEACTGKFNGYRFVPVYYMGSEDADLEELGHIFLDGEKLLWETKQAGAVGRMQTDTALQNLLNRISGELEVEMFGKELMQLLRTCYATGKTIQQATLELFNALFGRYGLVVLIADHPELKKTMKAVFHDDLFQQTSSSIVAATSQQLAQHYHVQAYTRNINLFYLEGDKRERIERTGEYFEVRNTDLRFTKGEMEQELEQYPERFSPNVILRGLYQEMILPNIAFIGGGGELAYWLQFKDLFQHYETPFPVLVLRNSFLVVPAKWQQKIAMLQLQTADFFQPEQQLATAYVKRNSEQPLNLQKELQQATDFYDQLKTLAAKTDTTLAPHVSALEKKAIHRLKELEKKILRAEKRKHGEALGQIKKIVAALFPAGGLQERIENLLPGYAQSGPGYIEAIRQHSLPLEAVFTILEEQ
jgi:bacillithiol synthase